MSDATELRAYIVATHNALDLKKLTNFGSTTWTEIDTDVLDAACAEAIQWVEAKHTAWNPSVYAWHNSAGKTYALMILCRDAKRYEEAQALANMLKQYISMPVVPQAGRRTVTPQSRYTDEGANRSPFTDEHWDGFL